MSTMTLRSRRTPPLALFVSLALCLSLAPPARPAPAPPKTPKGGQEPDSFKENIDVNLVNVDVVVVDKSGKLVTDLSQEDFQITDDGKKVKVDFFARVNAAGAVAPSDAAPEAGVTPTSLGTIGDEERSFIVFVDLDSTLPLSRNRVLDDVATYLTASSEPMSTMVVTYGAKGLDIQQPFTPVAAEWKAAIDAAKEMPSRGQMRQAEQRRMVDSIRSIQLRGDSKASIQTAREQLDELMGSVRTEAEAMTVEGRVTLHALQTLVSVLSTVGGRKSLLYVGDGVPVHPGEELFNLLADVFESDRRFAQQGGQPEMSPNPGSNRPPSEPTAGGTSEDTSGIGALEQDVTPMSQSTQTLRADAMSYDLTAEIRALTATANSHRVTIYGLSADTQGGSGRADMNQGGRTSPTATLSYDVTRSQIREQSLQQMAAETGGLALPPSAGVDAFLDRVMADEDNRYSLAYLSPHEGDSKFHRIKVKVNRKGVELRHREGYIDRPRDVRIGDLVAGALLLGSGENPHLLEMEVASQQPAANDETAVTLALHIPLDQLNLVPAGDNHEAKLDLYILTQDESGALAPMRYVAFTITLSPEQMTQAKGKFYGATLPVSLKKGPHTVAVGLVEQSVQRTSVVRTELEVGG